MSGSKFAGCLWAAQEQHACQRLFGAIKARLYAEVIAELTVP